MDSHTGRISKSFSYIWTEEKMDMCVIENPPETPRAPYTMSTCPKCNVYSCCLIATCYVSFFIIWGLLFSPGVFYVIFLEHLEYDSPPQVALGVALTCAATFIIGPIGGVLINRFGCRVVRLAGGLIATAGILLTTLSKNVYYMAVMFGGVSGIGLGIALLANTVIISTYFSKYRPIIVGITSTANGVGMFLYPPIIRLLCRYYDWRGMLVMLSGITLHLVLCAAIYLPPTKLQKDQETPDTNNRDNSLKSLLNIHIFKNVQYVLFCIASAFICLGYSVMFVHIAAYAHTLDITEDRSAFLLSAMGVANIAARPLWGSLNQLRWCSGFLIFVIAFTGCGVVMVTLPFATNYLSLQALCCVFGLLLGSYSVTTIDILVRLLGPSMMSSGYGYCLLFSGIGQAAGGPFAGLIYEATGLYGASMAFGGILFITGGLLMIPGLYSSCRHGDKSVQHFNDSVDKAVINASV